MSETLPRRPAQEAVSPELKVYDFHPLATIFPPLEESAFNALVEDIKANGQQEPIVLFEDKILDGRNRARACWQLKKEVRTRPYTGTDPIGFVLSSNLHRRHLNESQRAMVGAKLTSLSVGANQHTKGQGTSIEVASTILNVGRASIERARAVLGHKDPTLIEQVVHGTTSVSKAAAEVKKKTTKGTSNNSKKTAFDRFDEAWEKLDLPTQQAFVEARYGELAKLMKEVDRKAA